MDYKVSENFVVLALNPRSGNYMISGNYLNYGLIGAMLMDLAIADRITVSDRKVMPVQEGLLTGIPTHDRLMGLISKPGKPQRITTLLSRTGFSSVWYLREFRSMLVKNGILREERKKFLFIPYKLHYLTDPSRRTRLIFRLRDILLYNKEPDEREIMTLGLIYSCKLHRALSDDQVERKTIRANLKSFIGRDPLVSDINKAIIEIQAAITASLNASIAASSGHS